MGLYTSSAGHTRSQDASQADSKGFHFHGKESAFLSTEIKCSLFFFFPSLCCSVIPILQQLFLAAGAGQIPGMGGINVSV